MASSSIELKFRGTLAGLSVLLGLAGAWILVPEVARPPRVGFPNDQNYQAAADQRPRSRLAARVGLVRGDLWADLFFSFANSILKQGGRDFGAISTLDEAIPAAQRTLAFSPYRSEVWALLADAAEKYELLNPNSTAALMMSYYTAPYDAALAPLRLSVAARGDTLKDTDLQRLVEQDMRSILTDRPDLRPAVASAYAQASDTGKRFIKGIVQGLDPAFALTL